MTHYLVTGGCGFLGSNLVARIIESGEQVTVIDDLSRSGSRANLEWLRSLGKFDFHQVDVRDTSAVSDVVRGSKPDAVFHLAGQVAMTSSLADPRRDFEINAVGSMNILEAVRSHCPDAVVAYASTNKVYGDMLTVELVEDTTRYVAPEHPHGIGEQVPLDFCTPYGCSKGAADQYMLDYCRVFGIKTIVFRHSTIYGGRQFATFDQGWVGWFCTQASLARSTAQPEPFSISGNGKQVRDLLYVDDAVDLYLAAATSPDHVRGEAFNIGGGMANSCSLLELFAQLEGLTGCPLDYYRTDWRKHDQRLFVADHRKARDLLDWTPRIGIDEGVPQMLEWVDRLQTDDATG